MCLREIHQVLKLISQVEHALIRGKAHMQETNDKTQPEDDHLSQGPCKIVFILKELYCAPRSCLDMTYMISNPVQWSSRGAKEKSKGSLVNKGLRKKNNHSLIWIDFVILDNPGL